MIKKFLPILNLSNYKKDIFYVILFGLLSILFARVSFHIPEFENIVSNFREMPLLISLLYIRNPLYLIVLSLLTTLYTSVGIPYSLNFAFHLTSLSGAWVMYYYVKKYVRLIVPKTISWGLLTFVYFTVLLIPSYIIYGYTFGHLQELNFVESYKSIFSLLKIEGVTTILTTSLFLVKFEIQGVLIEHKKNLESIVINRTEELALANKKLTYLNENLDDLVKNRSKKISEQLNLIIRYAHMNSHEVRAPLARILGLLEIIKLEKTVSASDKVVNDLCRSGDELDKVIKDMNRLLEKETDTNEIT